MPRFEARRDTRLCWYVIDRDGPTTLARFYGPSAETNAAWMRDALSANPEPDVYADEEPLSDLAGRVLNALRYHGPDLGGDFEVLALRLGVELID